MYIKFLVWCLTHSTEYVRVFCSFLFLFFFGTKHNLMVSQMLSFVQSPKRIPHYRTSLVAQWLRIRLPMQGTRVRSLVREYPTCCGAAKPVHHSY